MRNGEIKMAIYNPASFKAEEFINEEEIKATLAYAEENKNNLELIREILEEMTEEERSRL